MGSVKKEKQPTRYIIHVRNHLDSQWEHWFEGMAITHMDKEVTILTGEVTDQSALFGILEKIHSLNLTLLSLRRVDAKLRKEGVSDHETG